MEIGSRLLTTFAFACLFAVPGLRGAGAADMYGSLAHNRDTGAYGFAYDYPSRSEADERARKECGEGCAIVLEFANSCGAYATGSGTSYGWGRADDRIAAERIAVDECRKRGDSCEVRVWGCTGRPAETASAGEAGEAGGSIEGDWLRVMGGSEKGLHVRGAIGDYDVLWENRYDGFRSLHRTGPRTWSCEAVYSDGSIRWTADCVAKLADSGRLIIDFSYPGNTRHLEFIRKEATVTAGAQKKRIYFDDGARCSSWCPRAQEQLARQCPSGTSFQPSDCQCNETRRPNYAEVAFTCAR